MMANQLIINSYPLPLSEGDPLLVEQRNPTAIKLIRWVKIFIGSGLFLIFGVTSIAIINQTTNQKDTGTLNQILKRDTSLIGDASIDGFAKLEKNLVFFDDFESPSSLSTGVWNAQHTMDGGGNSEFQYYTDSPEVLYVNSSDDTLRIKPGLFEDLPPINGIPALDVMTGDCTPYPECASFRIPDCTTESGCNFVGHPNNVLMPTISAQVNTKGAFTFQYGRLEMRVRMPRGWWLWPGLWMMPENSIYGGWPTDGELDLAETTGNPIGYMANGRDAGRDAVISTLHFMGNVFWKSQGRATGIDWSEDFHTFGLYWSDTEMYTYFYDDNEDEIRMIDLSAANGGYRNGFGRPPYGYDPNSAADNSNAELTTPNIHAYDGQPLSAPFNQPFYLILNVAVGGAQAGCPDPDLWGTSAQWCKDCWPHCQEPKTEFWEGRDQWYPSWIEAEKADKLSLAVDWVKVWQ